MQRTARRESRRRRRAPGAARCGEAGAQEEGAGGASQHALVCGDEAVYKVLSQKFEAMFQGSTVHRFQEAGILLAGTEPEVLTSICSWRKQQPCVRANLLAQSYFQGLHWSDLKDNFIRLESRELPFQHLALNHAKRALESTEITTCSSSGLPRGIRCPLTLDLFKRVCKTLFF